MTAARVIALTLLAAAPAAAAAPDPTRLPLGDDRVTTEGPRRGFVYACGAEFGAPGGGAPEPGPWIREDGTFDLTAKAVVDGSVRWAQARVRIVRRGTRRRIVANGLPTNLTTGTFPIAQDDDAYVYDRNPNAISAKRIAWSVPVSPRFRRRALCLPGGPIGVTTNGVAIFNGLDALQRDALAYEAQDACGGHPERSGMYHYHSIAACLTAGGVPGRHSRVVGYAADGYAIHGPIGVLGAELSSADLDVCHGHRHGGRYHYHATADFPYTLGCFRATPVALQG